MSEKVIYRDFKHWWSQGKHGFSSASFDLVQEIWNDLEPTIMASRDDYKHAFVRLLNENAKFESEVFDAALKYIEQHSKEGSPKFWRWFLDQEMAELETKK